MNASIGIMLGVVILLVIGFLGYQVIRYLDKLEHRHDEEKAHS